MCSFPFVLSHVSLNTLLQINNLCFSLFIECIMYIYAHIFLNITCTFDVIMLMMCVSSVFNIYHWMGENSAYPSGMSYCLNLDYLINDFLCLCPHGKAH